MYRTLIWLLSFQFKVIQILFKSKDDLVLETIELRQQLASYQTKKEKSENITDLTRSLLVALKMTWSKWIDVLIRHAQNVQYHQTFLPDRKRCLLSLIEYWVRVMSDPALGYGQMPLPGNL